VGSLDALLEVQALDTRADQIRHRRASLPEHAELAALSAEVRKADAEVAPLREQLAVIRARQRRHEDEAASAQARAVEVEAHLYDGSVAAHKELEALQDEHRMLKARQADLEDRALEDMEEAEPLLERLAASDAAQEQRRAAIAALEDRILVAEAELDVELDAVTAERSRAAASVPADVIGAYEPLRDRLGGVGAARLTGARCEGCHLEIPSAQLETVRRAPTDDVVTCPECGRILVR
jgi:uncharacterized protein